MKPSCITTSIGGARSFWMQSDRVELFVTEAGGHMAPVKFKLKHRWVSPYSLPPWKADEVGVEIPACLRILRGDSFCLPFGKSRRGAIAHGEPANCQWYLRESSVRRLLLHQTPQQPPCSVEKLISLHPGHRAVYQEHIISNLQGRYCFGHHAIVQFPNRGGPYFVNVSPFRYGAVNPLPFSNPALGQYSILESGSSFDSLSRASLATGGKTDLRRYPARPGFDDLVMISSIDTRFAWTAATLDGYVWFSLKKPETLPSTVLWFSNGGRYQAPWRGCHRDRLGLHEVNSYFAEGLSSSRKEPLMNLGIPTVGKFRKQTNTSIRLIQGVHPVKRDFGMVQSIDVGSRDSRIAIVSAHGHRVIAPVRWEFLEGEALC